jgi:hypothetical protein
MIQTPEALSLIFSLQRSIRYHDRREAHFDRLHKLTNVCTILIAGVVILELTGADSPKWIKWFAAGAAVLGAFDLVVGYSHRANQHRELKRRFCALERKFVSVGSPEQLQNIQLERSEIEADEPPVFRALDALCHNEMCAAKGYSRTDPEECANYRMIPWYTRITANWIRWANVGPTAH